MQAFDCFTSIIAPGLILFKGFLSSDEQIKMASWAMTQEAGWYNDQGVLNCGPTRGRIYQAWKDFSNGELVEQTCKNAVERARLIDGTMPTHDLTHLLLLRYLPSGGQDHDAMIWHRDDDENDGDNDHPVVSLSIGCTCIFGYKLAGEKEKSVHLESGDILLFGGPQRLVLHCVHTVLSNTAPKAVESVIGNARINFTFRDAPSVKGKEASYETKVLLERKN